MTTQRDLARWLLDRETDEGSTADALGDGAERVCRKLGLRLDRLVTAEGYRALVARALYLAQSEHPFLATVRAGATPDAYLVGLPELLEDVEPEVTVDALTAVIGGALGLLDTFIGEDLTLGLVREVWPDAPLAMDNLEGQEVPS